VSALTLSTLGVIGAADRPVSMATLGVLGTAAILAGVAPGAEGYTIQMDEYDVLDIVMTIISSGVLDGDA